MIHMGPGKVKKNILGAKDQSVYICITIKYIIDKTTHHIANFYKSPISTCSVNKFQDEVTKHSFL